MSYRRLPLLLACGSAIFLGAQAVYRPVPGFSSAALSGYAELQPFRPLTTPLWGALMQALAAIPMMPLAAAAALANVTLLALAVYLVSRAMFELPFRDVLNDPARSASEDSAPRAASALVSGLFLLASAPFQAAGLVPHADALGLVLLLGAWLFFQRFLIRRNVRALYGCAAALSLGAVESASVAMAAPLFAGYALLALALRRQITRRVVLTCIGCGLVGVPVLLASVALYYNGQAAAWREIGSFYDALDLFRREYLAAGPRAIPRQGWLSIFLLALLPLPMVFSRGFQQSQDDRMTEAGMRFIRFVLIPAIALVILFNLPVAPVRVAQAVDPLLTPYAAVALWFGRIIGLAVAWLQFPVRALGDKRPARATPPPLAVAVLFLAVVALIAAGWRNRPIPQRAYARALAALVDKAIDAAPDGGCIVTDGALDGAILIRARDRGRNVRALNVGAVGNRAYLRFLHAAYEFPDPDLVLATGTEPQVRDWMSGEARAGRAPIGLFALEPLQPFSGWRWTAEGWLLRFAPASQTNRDPSETLAALRGWRDLPPLRNVLSLGLARQRDWLREMGARWSNEMGVELARAGDRSAARVAFEQALDYQPQHLAALINLHECILANGEDAGGPEAKALVERIQRGLIALPRGAELQYVRARYGQIATPDAARAESAQWLAYGFQERAAAVAASADPDAALARVLRANLILAEGAGAHAAEEAEAAIATLPDAVLKQLALYKLRLAEGRIEEARALLAELIEAGFSKAEAEIESARIALIEQRVEDALAILSECVRQGSPNSEALLLRAIALGAAGREEEWRAALPELERVSAQYPRGLLYLAEMALRNRDRVAAVRYLERAHALQPGARPPIEALLEIELFQAEPDAIERRARALLAIDPDHPRAWYAIGVSMAKRGRWDLAAQSFDKSAAREASFRTLNDWAWSLHELGRADEALEKSAKATALRPDDAFLWATRGKIALDAKRYPEAVEAFERALTLGRAQTPIQLALLESYRAINNHEQAARVRADLESKSALLSESELRTLHAR